MERPRYGDNAPLDACAPTDEACSSNDISAPRYAFSRMFWPVVNGTQRAVMSVDGIVTTKRTDQRLAEIRRCVCTRHPF